MKKKKLLLILLLLCSCSNGGSNTSMVEFDSPSISSNVASNSETTSSSSSIIDTTSSSETVILDKTVEEIKQIGDTYRGFVNEQGVYESDVTVSLNLKLLACLDAITTKSGYGDRYKILMTDGVDHIYIKTNFNNYDYLKQYVVNGGVYRVTGNISIYNDEVEITVSDRPQYIEYQEIICDFGSIDEMSIEDVYEEIDKLKLNCKGVAFSKIVKIRGECLANDINNTNMYFGNGSNIINVHGHDKVTNEFAKGHDYFIIGALSMHNFRPGLELVDSYYLNEDVKFDTSSFSTIKASDLYNYKYETDEDAYYKDYSNLFKTGYVIKGYVNSYMKDDKECIVIEDTYSENRYNTYQNALSSKTAFIVNENYVGLTSSSVSYCPIYEHIDNGTLLDIVIFPYLWNTLKYPQVYCYSFS